MSIKNLRRQNEAQVELWGGIEATVNRVGDEYFDQLVMSGHDRRPEDLDLIAALGIKTLRYPVLWERTAPHSLEAADWSWSDARLKRLAELGITPIAGLVHHGSGPRYTNLLDDGFAAKLARYAGMVARRYPHLEDYTPVNEPLTTARFSGLYAHWYPHRADDLSFARMLINESRATILAMREIRKINSRARLIQTEDLGKVWGTPNLAYQTAFENERRWLGFDLLCGRVDSKHELWGYLLSIGIREDELAFFLDNPCPPDVLGINYYITSERYLDERLARYPAHLHGGNGRAAYADTEAVRVCAEGIAGVGARLREAHDRYALPLAVTEAHLACTREEQLRWTMEIWTAAGALRDDGVDVRAVTAWSLFGAFEWNSLVTRRTEFYEPGAFDLRSPSPRPTALAALLKALASNTEFAHPTLAAHGWWRRFERLLYPPVSRRRITHNELIANNHTEEEHHVKYFTASAQSSSRQSFSVQSSSPQLSNSTGATSPANRTQVKEAIMNHHEIRPLLITGATGTLGTALARICDMRGLKYQLLARRDMDITDSASVEKIVAASRAWAIINAAGFVRVDDAEREAERCFLENTTGARNLARAAEHAKIKFLTFSSDLVFDGTKREPYVESDAPAPLNIYGKSKLEAERLVLSETDAALVVRTSAFFGAWDEYNFAFAVLRALADNRTFTAADDAVISPTYVPDLCQAALDLLIDGERGIWHLASDGAITWADFARLCAESANLDVDLIESRPTKELNFAAARPLYSALTSERGKVMPSLENAVARFIKNAETLSFLEARHTKKQTAKAG